MGSFICETITFTTRVLIWSKYTFQNNGYHVGRYNKLINEHVYNIYIYICIHIIHVSTRAPVHASETTINKTHIIPSQLLRDQTCEMLRSFSPNTGSHGPKKTLPNSFLRMGHLWELFTRQHHPKTHNATNNGHKAYIIRIDSLSFCCCFQRLVI